MSDGSDAAYHGTTSRGSASLNLLGGLPDRPSEPSDTRSFAFTVNNVCMYLLINSLTTVGYLLEVFIRL